MTTDIIALEEKIAHLDKTVEDLSDVVADQATRIATLEKRVRALLELARDQAQTDGAVTLGDQPPPHW